MSTAPAPSDVTIESLTDWLYSLRTPVAGAYAVQQSAGFALVDSRDRHSHRGTDARCLQRRPEEAKESFRRLAGLDARILCVGHGPPITADAQSRLARVKDLDAPPAPTADQRPRWARRVAVPDCALLPRWYARCRR